MIVELLLLIFGVTLSVYFYLSRNYNYWKNKGIKYIKPTFLFGNLSDLVLMKISPCEHFANMYNDHKGEPFIGFFGFDQPCLLVRDTELIKHILVKDFNHFEDRGFAPDPIMDPLPAKSLFGLKNPKWGIFRSKLTTTFTGARVKKMSALVDQCCKMTVENMRKFAKAGRPIEMKDEMARCMTNSISTCAFGLDAQSLSAESDILDINIAAFHVEAWLSLKKIILFFRPALAKILRISFASKDSYEMTRKIIWGAVNMREKTGINRNDFLDLAMEIRKKGGLEGDSEEKLVLDGDDFIAHCYLFMIAGYETSSTVMSFTIYELARHTDVQDRARKEIDEVLEKFNGQISYDSLNEMKYVDRILSETMRKYPSLPFLDRICTKKYKIPGTNVTLEKGTKVYIPLMGLHYDPNYFEDPHRFNPDRYTQEHINDFPKMAYLPFGEGKRACIGVRFGQLQTRMALVHLLKNFTFVLAPGMDRNAAIEPKSFTVSMKGGIYVIAKELQCQ